jgi:hypothetical protein
MRSKRINRVCATLLAASLGALFTAASASAAVVTIGSPLKGSFTWPTPVATTGTFVNAFLSNEKGTLISPVDGTVIGWKVSEGFEGAGFRLQIVDPLGTKVESYKGGALSAPVSLSMMPAKFTANLPIKRGEGIGLVAAANNILGVNLDPPGGAQYWSFGSILGPNPSPVGSNPVGEELGFNAEILPAPTVSGISPTRGPSAGGTKVTITGTDFAKVTKVSFGAVAAASYKVESVNKIVAVAPPGSAGNPVALTVTTVAGSASSPGKFIYETKTAVKPAKGNGAKKG